MGRHISSLPVPATGGASPQRGQQQPQPHPRQTLPAYQNSGGGGGSALPNYVVTAPGQQTMSMAGPPPAVPSAAAYAQHGGGQPQQPQQQLQHNAWPGQQQAAAFDGGAIRGVMEKHRRATFEFNQAIPFGHPSSQQQPGWNTTSTNPAGVVSQQQGYMSTQQSQQQPNYLMTVSF